MRSSTTRGCAEKRSAAASSPKRVVVSVDASTSVNITVAMPVERCVVKARLDQLSHITPCTPTRRVGCSPGMAAFLDGLIESEAEDLRSIGRIRSYGTNVTLF